MRELAESSPGRCDLRAARRARAWKRTLPGLLQASSDSRRRNWVMIAAGIIFGVAAVLWVCADRPPKEREPYRAHYALRKMAVYLGLVDDDSWS